MAHFLKYIIICSNRKVLYMHVKDFIFNCLIYMSHQIGIGEKEREENRRKEKSIDLLDFLFKLFFDRLCCKKKKISIQFEIYYF